MLKDYMDGGGNVMVMLGEGGETKYETNINFLLEEFGIMVNNGTNFVSWYMMSALIQFNLCL